MARPSLKRSRGTNYNTLRQLVITSVDFNMQDTKNERKTSGIEMKPSKKDFIEVKGTSKTFSLWCVQ